MRIPETNPNGITSVSFSSRQASNGGISYNTVSSVSMEQSKPVEYTTPESKAAAKAAQDIYREEDYHRASLLNLSDKTWTTVSNQMHKVEKYIARERPDLADAVWDFSVKDGKIVVSGDSLSSKDKEWIEDRINSTKGLAESAANFISLASSYLETTKINRPYFGTNYLTGGQMAYNFHDTKKTLESTVSFRALSASLHRAFDTGHGVGDETIGLYSASNAFGYLAATALTASSTWGDEG